MPGCSGIGLTRPTKHKTHNLAKNPVIMLTGAKNEGNNKSKSPKVLGIDYITTTFSPRSGCATKQY